MIVNKNQNNNDNNNNKGKKFNYIPMVIAVVVVVSFLSILNGQDTRTNHSKMMEISYSEFYDRVKENKVHDVEIDGNKVFGHDTANNFEFTTLVPTLDHVLPILQENKVQITVKDQNNSMSFWFNMILFNIVPFLFFIGFMWFIFRGSKLGKMGPLGLGKSKAKLFNSSTSKIKFEDVAGVDDAKEDLEEVIEFLKDPEKFTKIGGKIPKGVLLVGPPGVGKTMLAKAVAGEAGVPFFSGSGSDFVEMFVGVGASRVRDLFEQAKKNSPCIVFIDEIDAIGKNRGGGAGLGGGNDERESTLNALLVEMDGFETNEGVILIGATNRADVLDSALTRPGRFDRQISLSNPDIIGREKILKVHFKNVPVDDTIDLRNIARGTSGFSGADLMNLVNESALLSARRGKEKVSLKEVEDAKDKILMGPERRTLIMSDEEKRLTAFHEGGHALVSLNVPNSMPIHKATIVPRGRSLGMVQSLPERDEISKNYEQMLSLLAMMMGGKAAEELIFGKNNVTSGAAGDIEQATKLARSMVTQFGFSDIIGNVSFSKKEDNYFDIGNSSVSETTKFNIEAEVKQLIDNAYSRAKTILIEKREKLELIANALLEYETLTGEEIRNLISSNIKPTRA